MVMISLNYWYWWGTIYLIYLTVQDYTNNRKVDDRKNWFMLGMTFSLLSFVPAALWYKLTLFITITALSWLLKRVKALGEADITSLSWILIGLGLLNVYMMVVFFAFFAGCTVIYTLLKNYVFKITHPVQYYGVILISYIATALLAGGY